MRRSSRVVLIGLLAAVSIAYAGNASVVDGFAALRAADDGKIALEARLTELDRRYAKHIAPGLETLESLSNEDLAAAFDASDMLAFYALHGPQAQLDQYVERMSRVLDVIAARDLVTVRQAEVMFDAFVASRDFASAERLVERFPDALTGRIIPRIVHAPLFDPSRPAVLELQPDGSLLARNIDRSGGHIVAIVGCGASQKALDEIKVSPDLADAFSRSSTYWLMPADRITDAATLQEWNARNPEQPAMFVYANAAWTNVAFDAMPHFQRFNGERLVASVRGWERGGGAAQLAALFDTSD
jgi:hypothetical protein